MSESTGVTLVPAEPWITQVTLPGGETFRSTGRDEDGKPYTVAKTKVKGYVDQAKAQGVTLVDKNSLADAEGDEARIAQNEGEQA